MAPGLAQCLPETWPSRSWQADGSARTATVTRLVGSHVYPAASSHTPGRPAIAGVAPTPCLGSAHLNAARGRRAHLLGTSPLMPWMPHPIAQGQRLSLLHAVFPPTGPLHSPRSARHTHSCGPAGAMRAHSCKGCTGHGGLGPAWLPSHTQIPEGRRPAQPECPAPTLDRHGTCLQPTLPAGPWVPLYRRAAGYCTLGKKSSDIHAPV